MIKRVGLIVVVIVAVAAGYWGWRQVTAVPADNRGAVAQYLTNETAEGFAKATEPGAIEFPRDFGPHEEYQTEWWYYTGNLATADGREFGYQFTIFRYGLTPADINEETPSDWRSNQVYFAHFTVSDIEDGGFYDFEKFSRGAADLAGAQSDPYHVWIENWFVQEQEDGTTKLFGQQDGVQLALNLTQTKPPVLHGDEGLSVKGSSDGNASYYYSLVQQISVGTVTIGDEVYEVTGKSWKDHEYSTSALEEGSVGWDWFSLQFDNADENALMLFQIRREDGSLQAESGGSWILADGSVIDIDLEDIEIEVLDTWTSPQSDGEYPVEWRISVPKIDLELTGRALMPNQELDVSTVYWEGAVRFTGTLAGEPVTATGYIEMTGYTGGEGRF